jgi:succinate-acetate transporter protein
VQALDNRVAQLESSLEHKSSIGAVLFLYGVFCALWAQNTGRSAWLWFFLGLLFSVITVIVLLVKNADDRKRLRRGGGESPTKTSSQAE